MNYSGFAITIRSLLSQQEQLEQLAEFLNSNIELSDEVQRLERRREQMIALVEVADDDAQKVKDELKKLKKKLIEEKKRIPELRASIDRQVAEANKKINEDRSRILKDGKKDADEYASNLVSNTQAQCRQIYTDHDVKLKQIQKQIKAEQEQLTDVQNDKAKIIQDHIKRKSAIIEKELREKTYDLQIINEQIKFANIKILELAAKL
jgi:chromosome segregation ATPase